MPDFVSLTCPACGAHLQVTPDLERFACGYCGNELVVRRSGGIVSLKPVMESLERVESKLDRNTEEIRRLRIVSEIDELQRSRAGILQTLAVQESTRGLEHVHRKRHPVRGVFLGLIAVSLLMSGLGSLFTDASSAAVGLIFGGLMAWWALRALGVDLPSPRARQLRAEAQQLQAAATAKRRELEQP